MDREKVITAWECCNPFNRKCKECPYEKDCYHDGISRHMVADAVALLQEQREQIDKLLEESASNAEIAEGMKELLKEQEAKQVIRKQCKKEHDDGSIDFFAEWYCPHCNMLILRGFDNPSIKFCYKCGKPVLWEGR